MYLLPTKDLLKVLSYWNLNTILQNDESIVDGLKVLSYWNLNILIFVCNMLSINLKYYHIGI